MYLSTRTVTTLLKHKDGRKQTFNDLGFEVQ